VNPLISVIVPIYNVEAYLCECVDSIIRQTWKNLEIILVDDESADACPEICDKYAKADSRVRVIHKKNGGPGMARNTGLDICRGDYIALIDSDDWIEPDMLESMLRAMCEAEAGLAICGYVKTKHDGSPWHKFGNTGGTYEPEELLREYIAGTNGVGAISCNKLYEKSLLENIRYPDFKNNEDAYIMHRIIGGCRKAVFVNREMYNYRMRPNSQSRGGFALYYLNALESANDMIEYTRAVYPGLKNMARWRKLEVIMELMASIVYNSALVQYRETYDILESNLHSELESMVIGEYFRFKEKGKRARRLCLRLRLAAHHPLLFRAYAQAIGVKLTLDKWKNR
jgi:glycosyltransferase involved in cell wall biosynthesis